MKHVTALIAFLMMIGSQASAFDTDDLELLKHSGDCPFCDLGGVPWSNRRHDGWNGDAGRPPNRCCTGRVRT